MMSDCSLAGTYSLSVAAVWRGGGRFRHNPSVSTSDTYIMVFPAEHSALAHGKISPPSDFPHQHTAPVAMRMPHLPITATTKLAEMRRPDSPLSPAGSPPSPISEASPAGQSDAGAVPTQLSVEQSPAGGRRCQICFYARQLILDTWHE